MDTNQNEIIAQLDRALEFGRELSAPDGRMRDPFEMEYGENFAPACFAVVAASRHRLWGDATDRAWAVRWGRRSAAIMREAPGLREYTLGYAAMVFALLDEDAELAALRRDLAAASLPPEELSPWAHILALQLTGDLLCPRGAASLTRAGVIVGKLEELWTPAGFPEDQISRDDGSIPHAMLTAACLAIFLVARPAAGPEAELRARIERLLARACDWLERANGPAMTTAQANRSYNQLWVYPLRALLAQVQRGDAAAPVVARCLAVVNRATAGMRRPNFLPNQLSAYAAAGNEHYNRVNNDVGAGGVGWALLAVLRAAGYAGLARTPAPAAAMWVDAAAGYAGCHSADSGVLLATKQHRWRYHYPLQPAWLTVGGAEGPFIGAKRAGVNQPHVALIAEPAKIQPLLEPYFGVLVTRADGTHGVMREPVEALANNRWRAALRPEGEETAGAGGSVTVTVAAGAGRVTLDYQLEGEVGGEVWLAVPVLLWDGEQELRYRIAGARVALDWRGRAFALNATVTAAGAATGAGVWRLRRERFWHTGFGVTGNLAFALGAGRAARVELSAEATA